jgi:2-polyprenyl-6-hydroxyphenyl methylase/3-demethylubiquinone-9 3-methyltransferase
MQYQQHEINKFNDLAHEWWNLDGEFKTLHQINPVRLQFIKNHAILRNAKVIDVGCGGGILAESLAKCGAQVTGIDLAPQSIETAKLHLYESSLNINYKCIDIADMAEKYPHSFDMVSCMEMLEHVQDPEIIIANCAKLLKPNGVAFFSTLNRTFKSYALGVIAAEYILKIIPKGTHNYSKFIKPSELCHMLNKNKLTVSEIKGLDYDPINGKTSISSNVDINYILVAHK